MKVGDFGLRLGIVGCADIAFKRFMPATSGLDELKVVAVAEEYDKNRMERFCAEYNLEGMESFSALIERTDLDAIYVPQPPALHHRWAIKAIENGKHVLVEKPSTTSLESSTDLVCRSIGAHLVVHENYMFQYHSQISQIIKMIDEGRIGGVRHFRISFGFPMRGKDDFRYNNELGGGALLDAGGYTLKLASLLLGDSIKVESSHLSYLDDFDVDIYGSAYLSNESGQVCEVAFGMDCAYQCNLEVWGSKGTLRTERIFTAPEGYEPVIYIDGTDGKQVIKLNSDDHFKKSILEFIEETRNSEKRQEMYRQIILQSRLVEDVRKMARR